VIARAPVKGARDPHQCPTHRRQPTNAIACIVFERYPSIPQVASITKQVLNTSDVMRPLQPEWRLVPIGSFGQAALRVAAGTETFELVIDTHPERAAFGGVLVIAHMPWTYAD
jgi:hypothetical protein